MAKKNIQVLAPDGFRDFAVVDQLTEIRMPREAPFLWLTPPPPGPPDTFDVDTYSPRGRGYWEVDDAQRRRENRARQRLRETLCLWMRWGWDPSKTEEILMERALRAVRSRIRVAVLWRGMGEEVN